MPQPYVLTLVASESSGIPLSPSILAAVDMTLLEHGVEERGSKTWLSEHKAVDIPLPHQLDDPLIQTLKDMLEPARVDHFITQNVHRRKKLLMADMDSTFVQEETLDEIASEFGLRPMVSFITKQSMQGEIDFETSLRKRVALLAGKPAHVLQKVRDHLKLNAGGQTLVETMRRHGATCVLASGGFTDFTSYVAKLCNFHHHHGNILKIKGEEITGFLEEPILDREAKLIFTKEYMSHKRLNAEQVLAIGDGANDRAMIEYAGLGIGYYPKPVLETATQNMIRYGDLTAALFAQGYKEKEFRYSSSQNKFHSI